ncbi:MAG: ankyrin repeat domain-containing protein, partial [Treponema sp.]|nr:ankyrin repeat domain-containing protein [Treponema sp.]
FGSRKGLQALGDIKALYEKEKFYGFTPSIFAYPAAYNTDPDVVDYLKELGFSAKEDEPDDDYRDRFTVLEAWQAGKNSKAVRDALLKAGASYSGKMLKAAFESGDLEKVKELTPLVMDKVPMLADVIYYYDTHSEQESCLPYIRDCLKCLKENGTDLNQKFDWEQYAGVCLMEFALNEANYDLILLYQSLGVEIPKKLGRFELLGMSDPMGCVAYNFNDYCREDNPNHPRAMDAVKLLDYLLQKGYDINEANKRGKTLLQRCCTSVYYNDVEFAKILLKRGADVNLKNAEGDTPLAILIKDSDFNEWSVKLLELLVANGADTSVLKDLTDEAREVLEHSGYNVKYDSMNNSYKLEK